MINADGCSSMYDFEKKYESIIQDSDQVEIGNDYIFTYKIADEWYGWSAINISHYGVDNWEYLGKVKPCTIEYEWYERVE